MPPKARPNKSSSTNSNKTTSSLGSRGGRGSRGSRGAQQQSINQDEITMSAAEVQSMKTELERLCKAERVQANKTAEAKRKMGKSS